MREFLEATKQNIEAQMREAVQLEAQCRGGLQVIEAALAKLDEDERSEEEKAEE